MPWAIPHNHGYHPFAPVSIPPSFHQGRQHDLSETADGAKRNIRQAEDLLVQLATRSTKSLFSAKAVPLQIQQASNMLSVPCTQAFSTISWIQATSEIAVPFLRALVH